jgi:hypothetical protein
MRSGFCVKSESGGRRRLWGSASRAEAGSRRCRPRQIDREGRLEGEHDPAFA